jgi:hypothetical protein
MSSTLAQSLGGVLLVGLPCLGGRLGAAEPAVPLLLAQDSWEAERAPEPGRPADSPDADAPLSEAARRWIRAHRELIHETAGRFGVPPLALAGIVAAERTLLHDPYDAVVDGLFEVYFATLTEEQLRNWVALQEAGYQRELSAGGDPGLRLLKNPYLWSVGPTQVSFRNVLFYEPRLARLEGRAERSLREIIAAVLSARGSLEYAAVILLEAEEAYARYADLDLSDRPGILATLYHLGSPTRRALRLGEENRRRELRGERPAAPRVNFYGEFVERHAADLEALLR